MPHVAIAGPLTPESIWLAFEPAEFLEKGTILKTEEAYLSADRTTLLVRSLTVERGFRKLFFLRILAREEGGVTVSLDAPNRPAMSDAVKRLVGLYAWHIMQRSGGCEVATTNLHGQVVGPQS